VIQKIVLRRETIEIWKRKTIVACYVVAGCAFVVALVSAFFLRHEPAAKRPQLWNTTAITAKYDEIRTAGEDNHMAFEYNLENNTDHDYVLENNVAVCLAVRLGTAQDLSPCHDNVEKAIAFPIVVRAGQSALIVLEIPKRYPIPLTPASSSGNRQDYHKALETFAATEMPNLRGFVLFDGQNHYEIDLPRVW
jgi:hypothetical protein